MGFCTAGAPYGGNDGRDQGNRHGRRAAYSIPAGHDARVEGEETFVGYEPMSVATYAKRE